MTVAAHAHRRADLKVALVQGEYQVSGQLGLVLTTTLGSCIASCLYDPYARVGGMNHFLLPDGGDVKGPDAIRYGAHAMELLINAMLHAGARKNRLEAKLFGGARMCDRLANVGGANADFAEHFLRHEGIAYLGGSVRGEAARRIEFWPATGRVRQRVIAGDDHRIFRAERGVEAQRPEAGSIELFED